MSYQKFKNRGPDYYGDVDEMDAKLVGEEEEMEIEGEFGSRRDDADVSTIS